MTDKNKNKANKCLLKAAQENDIGGVRAALADGADKLDSALIRASACGQLQAAHYMLDCGANPCFNHGRPGNPPDALREAVRHDHFEIAKLLLERGAVAEAGNNKPLRIAAEKGNLSILRLLVKFGANAKDYDALNSAAGKGHRESVFFLLEESGVDFEIGLIARSASSGNYQLFVELFFLFEKREEKIRHPEVIFYGAADGGNLGIILFLRKKGFVLSQEDATSMLRAASKKNHKDVCEYLLREGANAERAMRWNNSKGKEFILKLVAPNSSLADDLPGQQFLF
jgi:hypothetical protein